MLVFPLGPNKFGRAPPCLHPKFGQAPPRSAGFRGASPGDASRILEAQGSDQNQHRILILI
eukprot:14375133-Alexandrium_andersonii.AAC.1